MHRLVHTTIEQCFHNTRQKYLCNISHMLYTMSEDIKARGIEFSIHVGISYTHINQDEDFLSTVKKILTAPRYLTLACLPAMSLLC